MRSPVISVIIPTLNEATNLPGTLASLGPRSDLEILVVDGGSTDDTCAVALQLGCRVLRCGGGRGNQLAAGAKAAQGQWFWFVHADTHVPRHWRRLLLDAQLPIACLRLAIGASGWGFRVLELGAQLRSAWDGVPYGDQTLWVARSAYMAAGGYPDIPLFEDVELAKRLRAHGYDITYLHDPVHTSGRRWLQDGLIQRTLRNWQLRWRYERGTAPERLAQDY